MAVKLFLREYAALGTHPKGSKEYKSTKIMPPMVCPSPVLLDHSFPSSQTVLEDVMRSFGNIEEMRDAGQLIIVATPIFPEFATELDWQKVAEYPKLRDVHRYLVALFLQPNASYREIDVDKLAQGTPHPLLTDCAQTDLTDIWCREVGKLRDLHNACEGPRPFIGIACHTGFSGKGTGGYEEAGLPHLPLVGRHEVGNLSDSLAFVYDPNLINQSVPHKSAEKNLNLLGGVISPPSSGGSHYLVHFPGATRPWVFDNNIDPVSEDYLRQIAPLIGKPQEFVRYVLIKGEYPKQIPRI